MLHLHAGADRVDVDDQHGGRIVRLLAGGLDRLVGAPAPPRDPTDDVQWGCFVMAPWAGRIRDATFAWEGGAARLHPRLQGHALHGLAMDRAWQVLADDPASATLACELEGAPWPFSGARVLHRLSLAPGRLELVLEVRAGPHAMPAWVGWHPCFVRPPDGDVHLRVASDQVLVVDDETVPTGALADVTGPTDLRDGPALGGRRLDDTFVDVTWPVRIAWPDLVLEMTAHRADTVVVFTPAHEFCVEPQTGWPDAVHQADVHDADRVGLALLEPGETTTTSTTWTWTRPDA
ncbi:aldose 1-epimerase [Salsipaludibacter albus]|uniref:aldose 1-epimerase n=1 Tax=Salsipaludibacter albus TaxID=2849650 RepID=UPI001EE3D3E6|nr:hypothetical protein [Salsipaludibacter albus]MBY5162016.1 hypothetical protein [Salsipaludibacter albus]